MSNLKCNACKRKLYKDQTPEDHIMVCGGIEDNSPEAIEAAFGGMDNMIVTCCARCERTISKEDLEMFSYPDGGSLCEDCTHDTLFKDDYQWRQNLRTIF